jgi:hypothetical protein
MNVFHGEFDDEEERKRQRAEIRKYIEAKYPEPKYKPKIQARNWREIIKSIKMIRGQ